MMKIPLIEGFFKLIELDSGKRLAIFLRRSVHNSILRIKEHILRLKKAGISSLF